MTDIELYVFEDADGNVDTFTTLDADEARSYAQRYDRRWIAQTFEYSDSELVEDFTHREIITCGACGLSWDDSIITHLTPAPSARCPFESYHEYDADGEAIEIDPDVIPDGFEVQPVKEDA